MQITRQADYAVRAVTYLAGLEHGARASTAQIAEIQHIPATFLAKIVSQLASAGILHSMRGARGGVSLARPPEQLSLLEVVEAIDGPVTLNECVSDASLCPMGSSCSMHEVWCSAQASLVQHLSETRFSQVTRHNGSQPA